MRLARADWTRASTDDAIALARQQCSRAELPAGVERALVAYEAGLPDRKERPIAHETLATLLAQAVLAARGFQWPAPILRAIDELEHQRCADRVPYRLALAGRVWRVYRREGET